MLKRSLTRRSFVAGVAGVFASVFTGSTLTGCSSFSGDGESEVSAQQESAETDAQQDEAKAPLVVVFSQSGNTLKLAKRIQKVDPEVGFFRIEPVDAYTNDIDALYDIAKKEQQDEDYPKYKGEVKDWDSYETVFLGYPIWWGELPQVVKTFINDHDWNGKTIVPFNTHSGSGDAGTPDQIAKLAPDAYVYSNLVMQDADIDTSLDKVDSWYKGVLS